MYHTHATHKFKCHTCYQQFSCYSSLTAHVSRKHKFVLAKAPIVFPPNPDEVDLEEIVQENVCPVPPSKESIMCDLKLKYTAKKFVPESTFNDILSDLIMIPEINEVMGKAIKICTVKSEYESFLSNEMSYVAPEKIHLSEQGKHYIYVPIKDNLREYLSAPNMAEQLELSSEKHTMAHLQTIHDDFVHGQIFKNNNHCVDNPNSIGVVLYCDDFGSNANPLRQHTQKQHKTFSLYFSITNVQKKFRSQLKHHNLVILSSSLHIKEFGLSTILDRLINDLNELQADGIHVKDKHYPVCFVSFLGDNLGSNFIGGFTCGFNSFRPSRHCMISKPRLKLVTIAEECQLRTVDGHRAILEKVTNDPTLSTLYGVNFSSPLLLLENFSPILSLPPDVMHDLLEGCCAKEINLILAYAVNRNFLTWKDINCKIVSFDYRGSDKTNKPTPMLNKEVKGKAVQIWCLVRLFGLLFGQNFPINDSVWEVWKLLRQLTDYSLATQFNIDNLPQFKVICEAHLRSFINNFPDSSVTPKQHYTLHYPHFIQQLGLLSVASCMRFEGVHQVHKTFAATSKNFRNVQFTMATKFQKRAAYERTRINFLEEEVILKGTKSVRVTSLPYPARKSFETHCPNISTAISAKSVSYNSVVYHLGDAVTIKKDQFACIVCIYKCSSTIFLQCQSCETVQFSSHFQAFEIRKLPYYFFTTVNALSDHHSLSIYSIQNKYMIVPKYLYCVSLKIKI